MDRRQISIRLSSLLNAGKAPVRVTNEAFEFLVTIVENIEKDPSYLWGSPQGGFRLKAYAQLPLSSPESLQDYALRLMPQQLGTLFEFQSRRYDRMLRKSDAASAPTNLQLATWDILPVISFRLNDLCPIDTDEF